MEKRTCNQLQGRKQSNLARIETFWTKANVEKYGMLAVDGVPAD